MDYIDDILTYRRKLCQIPYGKRSHDICIIAIKKGHCDTINYVPREILNEDMCHLAIEKHGYIMITYIPVDILTEQMCMDMVVRGDHSNFEFLKYVPEKLKTYKLCMSALERRMKNFEYIPECLLTDEMYMMFIKRYEWETKLIEMNLFRNNNDINETYFKKYIIYASENIIITALARGHIYISSIPKKTITNKIRECDYILNCDNYIAKSDCDLYFRYGRIAEKYKFMDHKKCRCYPIYTRTLPFGIQYFRVNRKIYYNVVFMKN